MRRPSRVPHLLLRISLPVPPDPHLASRDPYCARPYPRLLVHAFLPHFPFCALSSAPAALPLPRLLSHAAAPYHAPSTPPYRRPRPIRRPSTRPPWTTRPRAPSAGPGQ